MLQTGQMMKEAAIAREMEPKSPAQVLFALAAAKLELELETWVASTGGIDEAVHSHEFFAPYYSVLKVCGYTPAECEHIILGGE